MKGKHRLLIFILLVLIVVVFFAGIVLGAVRVQPSSVFELLGAAFGFNSLDEVPGQDATIILYIRLPRLIASLVVGSALALCGTVLQGLFRNPMASPDILGVSSGASLGAVIAINTGLITLSSFFLPLLTVAGALISSFLIYTIASYRGRTSLLFIVLAGLAISSFFNGLVSAILLFAKHYEVSQFIFWTMGGFDGRMWKHVLLPLPFLLIGMALLFFFVRDLNLFAFGEEQAHALGMAVERTKRIILIISALVTGMAISIGGPIAFVGLLIPHFFRLLVGPDHRILMPVSALGGAFFLLFSDLLGRIIAAPFEIRVGIITALTGSPYFLYLIIRYQRKGVQSF